MGRQGPGRTGLSPSQAPLSRGLGPGPPLRTLLQTTIRTPRAPDSQAGLFPVRSPLLGESLLVSFPPLIDMLKLSGWPRLTWGRLRFGGSASADARPCGTMTRRPLTSGLERSSTLIHRGPWRPSRRGPFSAGRGAVPPGGHHPPCPGAGHWRRCVTPRQACPRPNGFGRNLRSKTRWFTGFCNSHQVSHFATFFIDARAEISVAESRFVCNCGVGSVAGRPARVPRSVKFSLAPGRRGFVAGGGVPPAERFFQPVRGSLLFRGTTMILPQVHLRKPCYDFSFL